MKLAIITLITFMPFVSVAQKANIEKIDIDLNQSKLEWTGKKVGGEHYGEIQLASGYLTFMKGKLTGGTFEMNMASITCVDITDEKSNRRLVDHLKSEDFFSAARFPRSSFIITKVEPKSATEYLITGDLAVKGKTNSLDFTAKVNMIKNQTVAEATLVFDRSKYDVKFGSESFFENLGDKLVYDEVGMSVKLVLTTRQ